MMDNGDSSCLYARLGVGLTAPEVDIKQAYRRLARQWHPDRHRGDDTAKMRFQEIAEAYEGEKMQALCNGRSSAPHAVLQGT